MYISRLFCKLHIIVDMYDGIIIYHLVTPDTFNCGTIWLLITHLKPYFYRLKTLGWLKSISAQKNIEKSQKT